MSGRKWMLMLLAALLLVFAVWGVLNMAVDPFNAFGDRVLDWDAYTQTLNPRNSKAACLSGRFDEFDGYIIGSSSAASFLPETLDAYTGCRFYNLFHYGADTDYDRALVEWLLKNDADVREVYLVLGLNEMSAPGQDDSLTNRAWYPVSGESRLSYFASFLFASPSYAFEKLRSLRQDTMLPQTFDVFRPADGTYDKRVRDVEPIGSLQDYLAAHGESFLPAEPVEPDYVDACAGNVRAIRALCEAHGVRLTVVLPPVSAAQLAGYSDDALNRIYQTLSAVTDYWNFQITPLTADARYFYDDTHTRNATINMVLAQIYGDTEVYLPEPFGVFCAQNAPADAAFLRQAAGSSAPDTATIPVLMYHHFAPDPGGKVTVLPTETFARQMRLLRAEGFHPISFADLVAYVRQGTPLPSDPVLITMDDGYLSNYTEAFPILRELQFPATIFAIGCSVGHTEFYKETDHPLTPHFGAEEMRVMRDSGLISVQSHTFDMHQVEEFETAEIVRTDVLPLENERQEDYAAALREDVRLQNELFERCGLPAPTILAFPGGYHDTIADVVLLECGYQATLTIEADRTNTVVRGLPQSLIDLGRMNVDASTTDEELLTYLRRTAD